MTLVSDIIRDAYREGNLLPNGQTPTTAETTEALNALNRRVKVVFGVEMGEQLADWLVPAPQRTASVAANFPQLPAGADLLMLGDPFANDPQINTWPYPPKNSRIVFGGVTNTVYFPEAPDDGSRMAVVQGSGAGDSGAVGQILTMNGNGRTIEASSTKTFTFANPATTPVAWFYRADLGDWKKVTALAAGDTFPFPEDLDDYWVCSLAMRLAPRHGKPVTQDTKDAFLRAERAFKTRYAQAQTTTFRSGEVPNSLQSYYGGGWSW